MNEINTRFKEMRIFLGLTQEQLGNILGLSKSGISEIENGRRAVTEQHLIMLRNWREKPINIEWLRTGEGEILKEMDADEEIGYIVGGVLDHDEKENPFYDTILAMMRAYHELDEDGKNSVLNFFSEVQKNMQSKKEED